MEDSQNNKSVQTGEFIQLIKSIIEYYGTTKTKDETPNSDISNILTEKESNSMDEMSKMLEDLSSLNMDAMSILIPKEIDEEIKSAFLSQIKYYKELANKTDI